MVRLQLPARGRLRRWRLRKCQLGLAMHHRGIAYYADGWARSGCCIPQVHYGTVCERGPLPCLSCFISASGQLCCALWRSAAACLFEQSVSLQRTSARTGSAAQCAGGLQEDAALAAGSRPITAPRHQPPSMGWCTAGLRQRPTRVVRKQSSQRLLENVQGGGSVVGAAAASQRACFAPGQRSRGIVAQQAGMSGSPSPTVWCKFYSSSSA